MFSSLENMMNSKNSKKKNDLRTRNDIGTFLDPEHFQPTKKLLEEQ